MKRFLYSLVNRLIDYVLYRPKTAGLRLSGLGVAVLLATYGLNIAANVRYQSEGTAFSLAMSSGEGAPQVLTFIAYAIGSLMAAAGLVMVVYDYVRELRREAQVTAVVVELRGLHSSPDTPAHKADLGQFPRSRQWLSVDFRPQGTELVSPELLLERVTSFPPVLRTLSAGKEKSGVAIAVGGLAAVPALFLAGVLLDDESDVTIFDWHRDEKAWQVVNGPDDGHRLIPFDATTLSETPKEVVLALALSYPIDSAALKRTFPSVPLVEQRAEKVSPDVYWSAEKQQAFVAEFRSTVLGLMQLGVVRIHLVLASPASLAIRMGMAYDRRLMPELLVYQYEKTEPLAYPWSILMPHHGDPSPRVIPTPVAP